MPLLLEAITLRDIKSNGPNLKSNMENGYIL